MSFRNWRGLLKYEFPGGPLFGFIPNQKYNRDSNETILETLSIPEKAVKPLFKINVNAAARFAWGQPLIFK